MNISTDDKRSQTRTRTLDVSSSRPRTDTLNASDSKVQGKRTDTVTLPQFYTMIKELTQVLEGDLSVKLAIPEGEMGVLAAVCNALIGKLVLFSRWTLYSAEQTHLTSRVILDHAFSRAQVAENQIHQIANIIGTLEDVVTSTRRLSSTLQPGATSEREQEMYSMQQQLSLGGELSQISREKASSLAGRRGDKEERERLEETSHALSENADTIEACISDLHIVAQALYASTIQVLQTTEQIGKLIEVAEDWKRSIAGLRLPEEEQETAETQWLL
jgi:hypothetical protein